MMIDEIGFRRVESTDGEKDRENKCYLKHILLSLL